MSFKYELLISHAGKINDQNEEKPMWASNLKKFLEIFLKQLLDRDVNIVTTEEITAGKAEVTYQQCATLATIITDNYVDDENCYEELRGFASSHGERAEDSIFKLTLSQVEKERLPEILQSVRNYDFYEIDRETLEITVFENIIGARTQRDYWLKLIDVAYDIYRRIKETESGDSIALSTQNIPRTVFLAETSYDQRRSRDQLKRELSRRGHKVVPAKPLPRTKEKLEEELIQSLSKCDMAIHIVGENYDPLMEDVEKSVVEIQNSIAASYSERFESSKEIFPRLIWVSPDIQFMDEQQQIFLDQLSHDKELLTGAEIIQTPLEFLKTIVQNKLRFIDMVEEQLKKGRIDKTKIYLISDVRDNPATQKLADYLQLKGYEILSLDTSESRSDLLKLHRSNLVQCDAAIIHYTEYNPEWIKMKLIDLVKAPGFGRKKRMSGRLVFSQIENPLDTVSLEVDNLSIIQDNGVGVEAVDSYLDKIERA